MDRKRRLIWTLGAAFSVALATIFVAMPIAFGAFNASKGYEKHDGDGIEDLMVKLDRSAIAKPSWDSITIVKTGRENVLVIDKVAPPATGIFGTVIATYQEPRWGRGWVFTGYNPDIRSYNWRWTVPNPDPKTGDELDLRWFNSLGKSSYVIWDMGMEVLGIRVYPAQDHLGYDIRTERRNYDRKNPYDVEYHEYDVYVSLSPNGPQTRLDKSIMWLEGNEDYPAIADDATKDYIHTAPFRYVKANPFLNLDYEHDAIEVLIPLHWQQKGREYQCPPR